MKRLATVTSLLLAFAGAASAQPWYGNGPRPAPVDRGHRYDRDRPYDRGVDEGMRHGDQGGQRWVTILDRYTVNSGRQFIPLSGRYGALDQIRIERANGSPFVRRVEIQFMNGQTQVVPVRRALEPGQPVIIDLAGGRRAVRRIIVYTRPDYQSAYSIYGS